MFKKALVGLAMLFTICFICGTAVAEQARDWKMCSTKLIITNTTNQYLIYNVVWLDHDINQFKGTPIPRAGGGLEPGDIDVTSKTFRLCPGRHAVIWYSQFDADVPVKTIIKFTVMPDSRQIVITPKKVFIRPDLFYKPPRMEGV